MEKTSNPTLPDSQSSSWFPYSVTNLKNLFSWYWPTSVDSCIEAENKLLSRTSYEMESKGIKSSLSLNSIQIGKESFINTLEIQPDTSLSDSSPNRNLVMTHGYGTGLGIFYRNYAGLAKIPNLKIFSIDWLGMGRSSRPSFLRYEAKNEDLHINEVEDFFVESLEEWRKVQKIEKMILLGHSLGGYLSAIYSLKYPERVEKLILVSPVGVPMIPDEVLAHLNGIKNPDSPTNIRIPRWAAALWNWNFTPQRLIRMAGPYGPNLVQRYISRRFHYLSVEEQLDLCQYIYHVSSLPGSGEYALSSLLYPGAYAKKPLIHRLAQLSVPTTFIYGSNDWMDHRHALLAKSKMKIKTEVKIVDNGSHNLHIDEPYQFNKIIESEVTSLA